MTGPKHPKKHAHDRPWRAPLMVAALLMLATPAMALDAGSTASGSTYLNQDGLEAAYDVDAEAYIDAEQEIDGVYQSSNAAQSDVQAELDDAVKTAHQTKAGLEAQAEAAADTAMQTQAELQAEADAALEQSLNDIEGKADAQADVSYGSRMPADAEPEPVEAESRASAEYSGGLDAKTDIRYDAGAQLGLPDACQVTSMVPDVKGTVTSTVSSAIPVTGLPDLGADLDAVTNVDPQPTVQEVCETPPAGVQADLRGGLDAELGDEPELNADAKTESRLDKVGGVFVSLWTGIKGLF